MEKWLQNALDYNESWLEFQMRQTKQPGCVFAVAYKGRVVFEKAYGSSNLSGRAIKAMTYVALQIVRSPIITRFSNNFAM